MRIRFVVTHGWIASIGLVVCVATAAAQSGKPPNPADPLTAAPAPRYESPFALYQPFRDENIRSWQEANKEVADNPGMGPMGSMKHTPGMTMPGMDAKTSRASDVRDNAASHNMGTMKDMPGKPMPRMDMQTATAPMGKGGAAGHNMGAMKDMPGMPTPRMDNRAAAPSKSKESATGHNMATMKDTHGKGIAAMDSKAGNPPTGKDGRDMMAMAKPQTGVGKPDNPQTAGITGTGVVRSVDISNGKVKLTHDPIAALDWPKMTLFFRLKDSALATQVKEGDKVEFSLEKSTSGYVISSFQKGTSNHDMKQMK